MKSETKEKVKFAVWGGIAGAIITMILGFAWGGWSTSGTTLKLANAAVLQSEASICVAQFMTQPNHAAKLAELAKVDSWKRSDFIENGGWDKMPGQKESSPQVSQACYDKLTSVAKI